MPSPHEGLSPSLTAIMCDGMGWFTRNDFKRALLLYDRISYLVPSRTVQFRDINGRSNLVSFPEDLREIGFHIEHFVPEPAIAEAIGQASNMDAARGGFQSVVAGIPESERLYTWRVTNGDADLGVGSSVALQPDEEARAHALLLNKFLLAADTAGAVPITGKGYINALIADKYQAARSAREDGPASTLKPFVHPFAIKVTQAIVSDEDLEARSEQEIVEYKNNHKPLFERFSYTVRKLERQVSALPGRPSFDRQIGEIINTEVWREKEESEREIQEAWSGFFKSAIKSAVAGGVALGVTPFLSLGALSLASILTGAAAVAPWVTSEAIKLIDKRKRAELHGMYYLMNFKS